MNTPWPGARPSGAAHLVGFGEAMLRLATPAGVRLPHARTLEVCVGGAELNAMSAAATAGAGSTWVTRLPDNPLGHLVAAEARRHGVDAQVQWSSEGRAGLYFIEPGDAPRTPRVVYDRDRSAFCDLRSGDVDWRQHLHSGSVLHVTGITLALGDGPADVVREAVATARDVGAAVSVDINYRAHLWALEEARTALPEFIRAADVLFASPHDIRGILDQDGEPLEAAARVRGAFELAEVVLATRQREPGGALRTQAHVVGEQVTSGEPVTGVSLDPIGAGDALAGVYLARRTSGDSVFDSASSAARAAALQHTVRGDLFGGEAGELHELPTVAVQR